MLLRSGIVSALLVCCLVTLAAGLPQTLTTRQDDCSGMSNCGGSGDGDDDDEVLPVVAIIAIAAGGGVLLVTLLLCLCVCCCLLWRRKRRKGSKTLTPNETDSNEAAKSADSTYRNVFTGEQKPSRFSTKSNVSTYRNVFAQNTAKVDSNGEPMHEVGSPDSDNPLYMQSLVASYGPLRQTHSLEKVRESGLTELEPSPQPPRSQSYVEMLSAGTIRDSFGHTIRAPAIPHSRSTGDLDLGAAEGMIYSEVLERTAISDWDIVASSPSDPVVLPRPSSFTDLSPAAVSVVKTAQKPPKTPPPSLTSTYKPPRPLVAKKPVWLASGRRKKGEEGEEEEQDVGGVDDYVDPKVFLDDIAKSLETYVNKDTIEEHLSTSRTLDRLDALPLANKGSRSPSRKSQTSSPRLVTPTHLKGASLLASVAAQLEESKDNHQAVDESLGGDGEVDVPVGSYESIDSSDAYLRDDYQSVEETQKALLIAARLENSKPRTESQTSDNMYVYMERQAEDTTALRGKQRSQSEKPKWGYEKLDYGVEEEEEVVSTSLYVNTTRTKPRSTSGPAKVVTSMERGGGGGGGKGKRKGMEAMEFPARSSVGQKAEDKRYGRTIASGEQTELKQNGFRGNLAGAVRNEAGDPVDEDGAPLYINVERPGVEEADEPEELYQNVSRGEHPWLDHH